MVSFDINPKPSRLMVDEKMDGATFIFDGKKLDGEKTYLLQYMRMNGILEVIGSGVADHKGNLCIKGDYNAPLEDLHAENAPKFALITVEVPKAKKETAKEKKEEKKEEKREEKRAEKREEKKVARAEAKKEKVVEAKKEEKSWYRVYSERNKDRL